MERVVREKTQAGTVKTKGRLRGYMENLYNRDFLPIRI